MRPAASQGHRGHVVAGVRADARLVAAAVAAGTIIGLLLPGIGGRLAMRVIALTSDPATLGMITDDGFVVGAFDLWQSVRFVVEDGMGTGIFAGLAWLAVRPLLGGSRWFRHVAYASTVGLFFGAMTLHPSGVDFTALGPAWLALVFFGLGPAVVFAVVSMAVERVSRPGGWFTTASEPRALSPLLVFLVNPFGLPLVVVAGLVSGTRHAAQRAAALTWLHVTHPGPLWAGRGLLFVIFGFSVSKLVHDTLALLGPGG